MKYGIKLLITGLLLFFIFRQVDPARTWQYLHSTSPVILGAALFLQMASNTTAALRWHLIMKAIGFAQPFSFFLKSYFKGAFFNQGLPTSIGGDGLRILDCARGGSTEKAIYGVFIDRIIGLAGLLLLNLAALCLNQSLLPARITLPLFALLLVLLVGLILLFFLRKFSWLSTNRVFSYLFRLSEHYALVYNSFATISLQLFLSVLTHLLAMGAFYLLGRGMGLDYPLWIYLVLVPPVVLLTILPISLAGWGVREGALVGLFVLIGADRTKVVSFSLLYGLTAILASLPGLVVYLRQKQNL